MSDERQRTRSSGGTSWKGTDPVLIPWGRADSVTVVPLVGERDAIFLREAAGTAIHRIEQIGIDVVPGETYTIEVIARPAGRSVILIELRDNHPGTHIVTRFDLRRKVLVEDNVWLAAIEPSDGDWVRCLLTIKATTPSLIFNVTLVDEKGVPHYQGTGRAGVHIRSMTLYRGSVEHSAR